jgi:hypothetical protein
MKHASYLVALLQGDVPHPDVAGCARGGCQSTQNMMPCAAPFRPGWVRDVCQRYHVQQLSNRPEDCVETNGELCMS